MALNSKQYNPAFLFPSFGGPCGQASAIKVTRNAPTLSQEKGLDGTVITNVSNDRSATIELTFPAYAPVNKRFSDLVAATEQLGKVTYMPFFFKDMNDLTVASAAEGCIEGLPELSYGEKSGEMTWKILVSALKVNIGFQIP